MAHNKLQLRFILLLKMLLLFCINKNTFAVNYNTYANNQHYLVDDNRNTVAMMMSTDNHNKQNPHIALLNVARNLQDYTDYRYYYTPPPATRLPAAYQQPTQQHHRQSTIQSGVYQPTAHLWSGPPIVVEDVVNQQSPSSTATTVFYKEKQQQQEIPTSNSNTFNRNLNTPTARHLNYNNNNNNIVYHRDFRPQIAVIPDTEHMQQQQQQDDSTTLWYKQQQQRQQYQRQLQLQMEEEYRKRQQQQQQQQQQFYKTHTNLSFNGISNDLRKDNTPADYSEHFRRYLANNPQRIKPIY